MAAKGQEKVKRFKGENVKKFPTAWLHATGRVTFSLLNFFTFKPFHFHPF